MEQLSPKEHLQKYITRYLISPPPGIFENAFDDPSFAVDLTWNSSEPSNPVPSWKSVQHC